MKNYEMVTILDPGLDTAAFEEKTKFLEGKIESYGGEIQGVTPWGKRKLAYDIEKKDAGYYVVINFQIESVGLLDFKESIKHDTEILRYLVVLKRKPVIPAQPDLAEGDQEDKVTEVELEDMDDKKDAEEEEE
jgi:small subunit ribosomal protein S6